MPAPGPDHAGRQRHAGDDVHFLDECGPQRMRPYRDYGRIAYEQPADHRRPLLLPKARTTGEGRRCMLHKHAFIGRKGSAVFAVQHAVGVEYERP